MDEPLTLNDVLDLAYSLLADAADAANSGHADEAAALNNSAQIALALASFLPEPERRPATGLLH